MNYASIIKKLSENLPLFQHLFSEIPESDVRWKPLPEKWCLLEVLCHLIDEEREDFRARVRHVLFTPGETLPPIDPQGWVQQRGYITRDFGQMRELFFEERRVSVEWLQSLENPRWTNVYLHPRLGPLSAGLFLANWLAHDYLHVRQILGLKHGLLRLQSGQDLSYAGTW